MSTRCNIEFYDAPETHAEGQELGQPSARIYKHCDGYPEGIIPMLKNLTGFLSKNNNAYGPRMDDPEWAAAEFISQFREKMGGNIYV